MCSNTGKKKNLISPLVFFLEMSLPLMHQIIRITSPLLFALALTAHIEQANTNLRARQEFWAQPILQRWAQEENDSKKPSPQLCFVGPSSYGCSWPLQRSREPTGQCPPPSEDSIAGGAFTPGDPPLRKPLALASGKRKLGRSLYAWEISAGNSRG